MKKWLLLLLAIPALAFGQTTTVSGNVKTISPNLPPNTNGSYVEFTLVNCGNNTPLVNGVAVLITSPVDFFADANGAITAAANGNVQPALYGNDAITCGGSMSSRYSVRYFVGGVATGPAKFYYVSSTVPFNLSTATPIVLLPPIIYPNTTTCPPGSYANGINNDLSVKCLNLPTGANDAVVTDPTGPQEIGNQPLTLDGPLFSPKINNVFYSQNGDTISSIEAACTLPCTYVVTQPQTITLASNHVLAGTINLKFEGNGSWSVNGSGNTLTIQGHVEGTLTQHFSGTAKVMFFGAQSLVPVEWFGAKSDASTDNCTTLQAALNSLTAGQVLLQVGQYNHSCTLMITHSNVGIRGYGMQVTNTTVINPNPPASILMNTSASADSVDVVGPGGGNFIGFNRFENFNTKRSVVPSGISAGISLSYTYGVMINRVGVEDSIRGFYIHATGSQGVGYIENSSVTFGYNGLNETSGNVYGLYLDSSDGIQNPSLRIRNSFVAANSGVTANSYGLMATGTAINDLMTYGFETAGMNYGEVFTQTGTGAAIGSSDIHMYGTINDGCHVSCILISGITAANGGGIEINGGYTTINGTSPMIDIESSFGVRVFGVQLGIALNANPSACIDVNNSTDVVLVGNQCHGVRNVGFLLNNSSNVAITGNMLRGNLAAAGLIVLNSSSFNAVGLNILTGTGASIAVDSSSNANSGLNTNTIAGTLTGASILGNNPIFNGASSWSTGAGAPVGACANGSFYSNSATTVGTFATYACRGAAWVGQGSAY